MKKIFISLVFSVLFQCVNAQQLTRSEVVNVAINTMRYFGESLSTSDVDTIYRIIRNDRILVQEVVFFSGESVLISGHRYCKPVIGYTISVEGSTNTPILKDVDELPDGIQEMLSNYVDQVEYCYNSNDDLPINAEWVNLQSYSQNRTSDIVMVSPLTTSMWGQDTSNCGEDPQAYNYYVTEHYGSCPHCFAGCGPVALAQIMYYWKHPVLSSMTENSFDWCNMVNSLNTHNDNYEKERNAVSFLIRKCGSASNARYCFLGDCSTGTNNDDVYDALQSFGYNSSTIKTKEDYTESDWISMIKDDLDNNNPVLYFGSGAYGHAFICDGYTTNGYFHFNWGWNGKHNDLWFTLENINPGIHDFSNNQSAIFEIEPSSNQDFCDFSIPLNDYYDLFIGLYGTTTPLYTITPQMMTTLVSAPSTSPASYRTIPAGATAEYVAHKEIILQPGFTAEYGSNFTARIEPCAACEERMVQMEMLTGEESENITDTAGYEMRMFKSGDTVILMQTSNLQLYPNPTDNTLTVKSPDKIENIRILDNLGRPVFRWFVESNADGLMTLNVKDIPDGAYIIQLSTSDKKTHFGRFIKK